MVYCQLWMLVIDNVSTCFGHLYAHLQEEQKLLDLGLQYSLEKPTKASWEHPFMETERAVKLLDEKLQNPFRILAAKK